MRKKYIGSDLSKLPKSGFKRLTCWPPPVIPLKYLGIIYNYGKQTDKQTNKQTNNPTNKQLVSPFPI